MAEFLQPVVSQQRDDLLGRNRPADEIALHDLATECAQRFELLPGLHPFGNGAEIQSLAQGENRANEGFVGRGIWQVLDEKAVDFQDVEREALQVANDE